MPANDNEHVNSWTSGHSGADSHSAQIEMPNAIVNEPPMKLIPWSEIWTSLRVAKIRGNGEMIEVFYDTLFREAVFDDRGAWALDVKKR